MQPSHAHRVRMENQHTSWAAGGWGGWGGWEADSEAGGGLFDWAAAC